MKIHAILNKNALSKMENRFEKECRVRYDIQGSNS